MSIAAKDEVPLDYHNRLERERIHLLLLEDAKRGLADIATGRTEDADAAVARLQPQYRGELPPRSISLIDRCRPGTET